MRASMCAFGEEFQAEVTDMVKRGLTDTDILNAIAENHSISVSQRTLTRRKEDWGIIFQPTTQTNQLEDSIRTYFEQGLTYAQIHHALTTSHDYTQSIRTLERKIQSMSLTRRTDDLDNNKVDMNTVVSGIEELHYTSEGRNTGYRKIRQLLQQKYGVSVHNITVAMINRTLDPEGVDNRSKRVLKRRVFHVPGPNYIWSADGHDKLKKFRITIYGFINAWSRKVLGIFVHVTNNDPRHIGYYYLQLVKSQGGIPRRTTTDRGTETIHMAGHQINLTSQYNAHSADPSTSHLFTKSTHNQKIECLWSQLMKQYNCELINQLFNAEENELYNKEDSLEKTLFIYFAQWCYDYPLEYNGEQGLVPVPPSAAETLEHKFYPQAAAMMEITPSWFSEAIRGLLPGMQITIPPVDVHNVWQVFGQILEAIRKFDDEWLADPTDDPSETFSNRAAT
ncbi:hypothetical protein Pst134EA_002708 [Puccinia striiformis f. sp. tritici]|uniref:hypothetical protein n=1 Tax=Puccinia striiformis f. sp. tritici TaxID=168172 RepID=UPI002008D7B7|nr:hypothetical protein Pst134EA_002708 [Puccinia striiformis f. sp. tritici]KAH9472082.1 hypothetical protein Pst134EA_002708 [Puccinia striiformis f. sp. tritici]